MQQTGDNHHSRSEVVCDFADVKRHEFTILAAGSVAEFYDVIVSPLEQSMLQTERPIVARCEECVDKHRGQFPKNRHGSFNKEHGTEQRHVNRNEKTPLSVESAADRLGDVHQFVESH